MLVIFIGKQNLLPVVQHIFFRKEKNKRPIQYANEPLKSRKTRVKMASPRGLEPLLPP